jgi:hypothetical protein
MGKRHSCACRNGTLQAGSCTRGHFTDSTLTLTRPDLADAVPHKPAFAVMLNQVKSAVSTHQGYYTMTRAAQYQGTVFASQTLVSCVVLRFKRRKTGWGMVQQTVLETQLAP